MGRWGNSRELTRASYSLVKEQPGLYRWTVRAAVHAAVVGGVGVVVGLVLAGVGGALSDTSDGSGGGAAGVVLLVAGVVVLVAGMVAGLTAANRQLCGLVRATDEMLHGRDPDGDTASASGRPTTGTLAAWSAISVAVGFLVSLIRGDGDSGIVVAIVRALVAGLVAAVWAVVTTLVLPVIVLEGLGAVPAIQRSTSLIRHTWGEAVFGSVRIGARFALLYTLPGFLLVAGGIVLAVSVGGAVAGLGALLVLGGVVLMLVGAVRAATCRTVFGVALYRWTTGDGALGPFSEEDLRGAVRTRSPVA